MGKREIEHKTFREFIKRHLAAALFINLSLSAASTGGFFTVPVCAQQSDKQAIEQIEQKLFFKTYEAEDLESRLKRIEKRVFGESMTGAAGPRIQKVKVAMGPLENSHIVNAGSNSHSQSSSSYTASPNPPATPNTMTPTQNNADAALERAKISVQAAKEEEVSKLLADGVELWRKKQGPQAISKFEQVIRLDPHNAEAHFSMGIVYESSGNLAHAESSYKLAAQEAPSNREYQEAIHAIEKKVGAKQPLEAKKGEMGKIAEEASAAYKRGDYMTALSLYKQLDKKTPNQALIKYNIGSLYLSVKDPYSALEYYKQAQKLKPTEPKYTQAAQQLQASLNKAQAAEQSVQQAWNQVPAGTPMQHQQQPMQQQGMPMQQMPMQQQGMPMQQMPMQQQGMPMQQMPMQQQGMPMQQMPMQQQGMPMQQMPMQQQGMPMQQGMPPNVAPQNFNQQMPQQYAQQQGQEPQPGLSPMQNNEVEPVNVPPVAKPKPKTAKASTKTSKSPASGSLLQQPHADQLAQLGLITRSGNGALIIVQTGIASRASHCGLQNGDVIKAIDGTVVTTTQAANNVLSKKAQGAPVSLLIQRGNQVATISL